MQDLSWFVCLFEESFFAEDTVSACRPFQKWNGKPPLKVQMKSTRMGQRVKICKVRGGGDLLSKASLPLAGQKDHSKYLLKQTTADNSPNLC